MDASQARGVNEGLWRGHGGFELALAPVIFALAGLWIDGRAGTTPLFTILGGLLAFIGVVVKHYYVYKYNMALHDERRLAERERDNADADRTAVTG